MRWQDQCAYCGSTRILKDHMNFIEPATTHVTCLSCHSFDHRPIEETLADVYRKERERERRIDEGL